MTVTVIGDNTGDDYAGTEDSYIRSNNTTANYGSDTVINLKNETVTPADWNGILSFSGLSNISASEVVSDATVGQYLELDQGGGTYWQMRRVLRNWVEAQVTWDDYATSNAWTTGGCRSDGNDRSATLSAQTNYGSTSTYNTANAANLTTDVGNFVNGTWNNYGWVQELEEQGTDSTDIHRFTASDGTDGQRPYLSVTHAAGGNIASRIKRTSIEGQIGIQGQINSYFMTPESAATTRTTTQLATLGVG